MTNYPYAHFARTAPPGSYNSATAPGGSGGGLTVNVDWQGAFTLEWQGSYQSGGGDVMQMGLGAYTHFTNGAVIVGNDTIGHPLTTVCTASAGDDGTWHGFAITCGVTGRNYGDALTVGTRTFKIYIDGVFNTSGTISGVDNISSIIIGNWVDKNGNGNTAGGKVSNVRFFECERTAAEIAQWWNINFSSLDSSQDPGGFGGFVGNYPCNECTGTTIHNYAFPQPTSADATFLDATIPAGKDGWTWEGCVDSSGPSLTIYTPAMGPIGPLWISENLGVSDSNSQALTTFYPTAEEDVGFQEGIFADVYMPMAPEPWGTLVNLQFNQIDDNPFNRLDVFATESFGATDGVSRATINFDSTVIVGVRKSIPFDSTVITGVRETINNGFSAIIGVLADNLVAVTNATSLSNPTTPTFVSNGVVVYSNAGTLPSAGEIAKAKCYVNFTCNNLVGSLSASQLLSWNMSLNDQGGTWNSTSTVDLPTYGSEPSVFGFKGTITKKGFNYSSSSAGYSNSGIFGSRNLNRELAFLIYGNPSYSPNIVNQNLQYPKLVDIKTHSDAARLIASLASISISWNIPDYQLLNWQPQASMTALQALSSLASECGGVLRWNGGTSYLITYPDRSTGNWTVPNCCLITAMSKECSLDLNSGFYNPGTYLLPQYALIDAGTALIIAYGQTGGTIQGGLNTGIAEPSQTQGTTLLSGNIPGNPALEQVKAIYTTPNVYSGAIPYPVQLDLDTQKIWVQSVFETSSDGGTYSTYDSNSWTLVQAGLLGPNTILSDKNGQIRYNFQLGSNFFPSTTNADVTNKKWYLRVGVTKNAIPAKYVNEAASSLAKTLMKYRFIPMCTGSISCAFFGSIPVPGMTATATFNGQTISGIIESVSFSNPGTITVNFVNWAKFEFYSQLKAVDNTFYPGFG